MDARVFGGAVLVAGKMVFGVKLECRIIFRGTQGRAMDMDGSLFRVKASITRKGGGSMHRKLAASVALSIAVMFCDMPDAYAEDVWSSSNKVTGEWGNVLVNDYVVTDSIQGDDRRFTVDVKHVGDISKNQLSVLKTMSSVKRTVYGVPM